MRVIADDLLVCTDCTLLIANGETGNGIETDELVAAAQVAIWGDDAIGLTLNCPEDCDGRFSSRSCDGCGDPLAGDRHPAVVLSN